MAVKVRRKIRNFDESLQFWSRGNACSWVKFIDRWIGVRFDLLIQLGPFVSTQKSLLNPIIQNHKRTSLSV